MSRFVFGLVVSFVLLSCGGLRPRPATSVSPGKRPNIIVIAGDTQLVPAKEAGCALDGAGRDAPGKALNVAMLTALSLPTGEDAATNGGMRS